MTVRRISPGAGDFSPAEAREGRVDRRSAKRMKHVTDLFIDAPGIIVGLTDKKFLLFSSHQIFRNGEVEGCWRVQSYRGRKSHLLREPSQERD